MSRAGTRSGTGPDVKRFLIAGIAGIVIATTMAPVASAQPPEITNCRTDVMNHGRDSYTYCDYIDESGTYRIVTTCLGNIGCTTRRAH